MGARELSRLGLSVPRRRRRCCGVAGGALIAAGLLALASERWSLWQALLVSVIAFGVIFALYDGGTRLRQRCDDLEERLAAAVRERDLLAFGNDELRRRNVELRTMHVAFADLLNLVDERTHGRVRDLVEDTGEDLALLLAGFLAEQRDCRP